MWYPEILNRMATFEKDNPGQEITVCTAIRHHILQEQTLNETMVSYHY